jgi:hypothetical protein
LGGLEGKYQKEKQLRDMGIDPDIAEDMANKFGLVSGAVMGGVSHSLTGVVGKRIIKELVSTGLVGGEMAGLTSADNLINEAAVNKMKAKHGKDWEPKTPLERQDPLRSAVLGVTMAAGTKAVTIPYARHVENKAREARILAAGGETIASMERNEPVGVPDEYFNPQVNEPIFRELRKREAEPVTPEKLTVLADGVEKEAMDGNNSRAVRLANLVNKKRGTGIEYKEDTPLTTLMTDIRSHLGLINEGPRWGVAPAPAEGKAAEGAKPKTMPTDFLRDPANLTEGFNVRKQGDLLGYGDGEKEIGRAHV